MSVKTKNQKYQLEFEMRCSPKILYNYLVDPSGLTEWFADDVIYNNGNFIFEWDGQRTTAKIAARKENSFVKFQWLDGENEGNQFSFEIVIDELTNDVALVVSDSCNAEDISSNQQLWDSQIHELRTILGS